MSRGFPWHNTFVAWDAEELRMPQLARIAEIPPALQACSRLRVLEIRFNQLLVLEHLPGSLRELQAGRNRLALVRALPGKLEVLGLSSNRLVDLPPLPATLRVLNISFNPVARWPTLPETLEELFMDECPMPPALPSGLQKLSARDAALRSVPADRLPAALRWLDLSANLLVELPPLPPALRYLDVAQNPLRRLQALPDALETLNLSFTRVPPGPLPGGLQTFVPSGNFCSAPAAWAPHLPPYLTAICGFPRDPVVAEVNSGRRAAAQRERDRREILRDWLSCCPLVHAACGNEKIARK